VHSDRFTYKVLDEFVLSTTIGNGSGPKEEMESARVQFIEK